MEMEFKENWNFSQANKSLKPSWTTKAQKVVISNSVSNPLCDD